MNKSTIRRINFFSRLRTFHGSDFGLKFMLLFSLNAATIAAVKIVINITTVKNGFLNKTVLEPLHFCKTMYCTKSVVKLFAKCASIPRYSESNLITINDKKIPIINCGIKTEIELCISAKTRPQRIIAFRSL